MKNGTLKRWDFFQQCGVHSLNIDGRSIFLLEEKDYPTLNCQGYILHQMMQPKMMHLQFVFDERVYKLITKYEKIYEAWLEKR